MRSMWRFSAALIIVSIFMSVALPGYGDPNADVNALSAMRNVLTDPDNQLATWDSTNESPCNWHHISCNEFGRVVQVDLSVSNIGGDLSQATTLLNLDQLQYLYIFENNFVGSIPVWIGNLTNLLVIDFNSNKLTGTIPPLAKLRNLTTLNLSKNSITGPIPIEVGNLAALAELQKVDLSNNDLCGEIPERIKYISNLNLRNNPRLGLSGSCP